MKFVCLALVLLSASSAFADWPHPDLSPGSPSLPPAPSTPFPSGVDVLPSFGVPESRRDCQDGKYTELDKQLCSTLAQKSKADGLPFSMLVQWRNNATGALHSSMLEFTLGLQDLVVHCEGERYGFKSPRSYAWLNDASGMHERVFFDLNQYAPSAAVVLCNGQRDGSAVADVPQIDASAAVVDRLLSPLHLNSFAWSYPQESHAQKNMGSLFNWDDKFPFTLSVYSTPVNPDSSTELKGTAKDAQGQSYSVYFSGLFWRDRPAANQCASAPYTELDQAACQQKAKELQTRGEEVEAYFQALQDFPYEVWSPKELVTKLFIRYDKVDSHCDVGAGGKNFVAGSGGAKITDGEGLEVPVSITTSSYFAQCSGAQRGTWVPGSLAAYQSNPASMNILLGKLFGFGAFKWSDRNNRNQQAGPEYLGWLFPVDGTTQGPQYAVDDYRFPGNRFLLGSATDATGASYDIYTSELKRPPAPALPSRR